MASTLAKMPQGSLACQSRVMRFLFLQAIDGANIYPNRPECELVDSQLQRNDLRVRVRTSNLQKVRTKPVSTTTWPTDPLYNTICLSMMNPGNTL